MNQKLNLATYLILILISFSHLSFADVLSPTAAKLNERASKNPQLVDRTDQYCLKKKIADACMVPGDHFSGGGNGKCERILNESAGMLDLHCEVQEKLVIDRRLPSGGYKADADICNDPQLSEAVCGEPPIIADQFCEGKKAGDACSASGQIQVLFQPTINKTYQGQCLVKTEVKHKYFRGHITLTRPTLMCSPLQPAPDRNYQDISLIQRLRLTFQ